MLAFVAPDYCANAALSCSLIEYLKDAGRLVASRDMHICATFARRFFWSDLNL